MTSRSRNILVGLVVLFAMVALGWMILRFSNNSFASLFSKGLEFRITADRADGVSPGSALTYLGVPVGQVTEVRRSPDNAGVVMQARLNSGEQVPSNVVGFIRASSALSMAAGISLETEGGPAAQPLPPNGEVKAFNRNQGLVPPEFTDLARSVRDRQLIAHVDEAVVEVRDQVRKVGQVMESLNKLVGDPKVRDDLTSTIASIKATGDNLQKFSANLQTVSGETTETLKQVRTSLADGSKRFDELTRQIGDRLTQIGELMDKFNGIAAKVDKGQGTMGALVNDARLYESLIDASKTMNLTIGDLRRLVQQWEEEGVALRLGK